MKRGGRRADVTTLIGIPLSIGLIVLGHVIEGGKVASLVQTAAALIVFGGTFGAVLVSFNLQEVKAALTSVWTVFADRRPPSEEMIGTITRYAVKARKDGIMSLEDELDRIADPFLRRGLGLAVDGTNPNTLRATLEAESDSREEVESIPYRVFESAGGYAPTIGILGAVLGLIHVMENLADPSKLGAGIAVAFVATVYGVGSANLVFLPIATKLRSKADESRRRRQVVLEGILAIQEGQNPRLIEQKLRGLLGAEEPLRKPAAASRAA